MATLLPILLSCRTDSLPIDVLVQKYWDIWSKQFQVAANYTKCLKLSEKKRSLQRVCDWLNSLYCGRRFGEAKETQLPEYRKILSGDAYRQLHIPQQVREHFRKYTYCIRLLRHHIDLNCTSLFSASFSSRQLRATKTVRATMARMELLQKNLPNFRIIHLICDPHGVELSRRNIGGSVVGRFSQNGDKTEILQREARLYCRTVVADLKVRLRLEELYPGNIYPLIFDCLVTDLQKKLSIKFISLWTRRIHQAISSDGSNRIHEMEKTMRRVKRYRSALDKDQTISQRAGHRPNDIVARWARTLTREQNCEVHEVCREFCHLVGYDWMTLATRRRLPDVKRTYNRHPNTDAGVTSSLQAVLCRTFVTQVWSEIVCFKSISDFLRSQSVSRSYVNVLDITSGGGNRSSLNILMSQMQSTKGRRPGYIASV